MSRVIVTFIFGLAFQFIFANDLEGMGFSGWGATGICYLSAYLFIQLESIHQSLRTLSNHVDESEMIEMSPEDLVEIQNKLNKPLDNE